jgi:hypothetical protein
MMVFICFCFLGTAVTMQDRIMIYNNQIGYIGWAHDPCESRTESESVITSRL